MLIKLLLFFLLTVLMPILVGFDWSLRHKTYPGSLFLAYFYGIFIEFTLFELLAVPMVFLNASLRLLSFSWLILSAALAVASMVRSRKAAMSGGRMSGFFQDRRGALQQKISPLLVLVLICIFLQILFVTLGEHIDDDDAFFVATATTAVQTNTLMTYNPFTGALYKSLPSRYVFASWPLYLASLSTLTGFHPALIAHLLMPGIEVATAYLIYALIARDLFPDQDDASKRSLFLLLILLILSFSGFSVYTNGTFLFVRGWQGKALVAALTQPALFYLCRSAMKEKGGWTNWAALFCTVTASCMFSSMGVVLATVPVAVYTLSYAISGRQWRIFPYAIAACAGAILCGVAYLLIR